MKIRELQISNILSFTFFENVSEAPKIVFGPDLNIIIGENGSGKSTALEVVNFIFKRVLFTQFNFNQDHYSKRETLTAQDRKATLGSPGKGTLNSFRLEPTWGYADKPQKIRVKILLDEIDKKNIALLLKHRDQLNKVAGMYSGIAAPDLSSQSELNEFTVEISLQKTVNSYSHEIEPKNAEIAFSYLANYNFYRDLIRIHNIENPSNLIDSLYEPFALISSFRNYNTFNTVVSLQDRSGAQQIQIIYTNDFSTSLNSTEIAEPAVFNLVRLRIADQHFSLVLTDKNQQTCEEEVNSTAFLKAINKKLKLINLECRIKLTDQRRWRYSFEFRDTKRNTVLSDINSLSAGQKAIVHLVFEAYGRGDLKGGLVIVDEPELHLHYQFQHEYLRVIQQLNRDQDCQYVLVSHSEALINSVTIHNVKRFALDENRHTKIVSPNLTAEQKLLVKILDNTRATYAFFGKKVLLVEGETDRYFFKAALHELNPELGQEISVLDIGGKASYESWRDFFQSFGLTVFYIGDFDNVHTLKRQGKPLVERAKRDEIDNELKQECLNNLSEIQKQCFEQSFNDLTSDPKFLSNPKRRPWKALLDLFLSFVKIKKEKIVERVRLTNGNIEAEIEGLYSENIFILKKGDLETYLGLETKGLAQVISFCNESLKEFLGGNSDEAKEVKTILQKLM